VEKKKTRIAGLGDFQKNYPSHRPTFELDATRMRGDCAGEKKVAKAQPPGSETCKATRNLRFTHLPVGASGGGGGCQKSGVSERALPTSRPNEKPGGVLKAR